MIYRLRNLANNHSYAVPPGDVVVGRSAEAQVFIDHESVSRRHVIIHNFPNGVWIEDLQTTNGTLVRGELIKQSEQIQPGEIFQIGLVDFRLDPETFDDAPSPDQDSIEKLKRKTNNVLAPVKIEYKARETQSVPNNVLGALSSTVTAPVKAPKKTATPQQVIVTKSKPPMVIFLAGLALGLMLGILAARLW